jgi:hypothetical protein
MAHQTASPLQNQKQIQRRPPKKAGGGYKVNCDEPA